MAESGHLETVRARYDEVAAEYVDRFRGELERKPVDLGMLRMFAECARVRQGPVLDVGSGPGWVTAHLSSMGLDVSGVDLSPEMIAFAQGAYPKLRFRVGSLAQLDIADGTLGGIVARYSIIHLPPLEMSAVLGEFVRTLALDGQLLLGFQSGDESLLAVEQFDHKVCLGYRWPVDELAEVVRRAGLVEVARVLAAPTPVDRFHQGWLLARKS